MVYLNETPSLLNYVYFSNLLRDSITNYLDSIIITMIITTYLTEQKPTTSIVNSTMHRVSSKGHKQVTNVG